MKQQPVHLWVVVVTWLVAASVVFAAVPMGAAQNPAAPGSESDWSHVERLPLGARILIEQTDGKRLQGRLLAAADDAISVGQRKRVVGVARPRVARVWLLGERKIAMGLAIGTLAGASLWPVIHAIQWPDAFGAHDVIPTLLLAGAGAGIGAAMGAGFRERVLIYRAPSREVLPAATGSVSHSCTTVSGEELRSLPLRDVCRVFSADEVAKEVSRNLAQAERR